MMVSPPVLSLSKHEAAQHSPFDMQGLPAVERMPQAVEGGLRARGQYSVTFSLRRLATTGMTPPGSAGPLFRERRGSGGPERNPGSEVHRARGLPR